MISKLFRLDPTQRREKTGAASRDNIKTLRELAATQNITSVAVPKYRVRGNFVEYVIECSQRSRRWNVFRRYQQFRALDHALRQLCSLGAPHHCDYGVLPVLSGSHWTEVTNQSVDLVERRRRFLEIYLEQLLVPNNLFYVAKTALYKFLHDGEVVVRQKTCRVQPLIGFSTVEPPPVLPKQQRKKKKEEEDEERTEKESEGCGNDSTTVEDTRKTITITAAAAAAVKSGAGQSAATTNGDASERGASTSWVSSSPMNMASRPEDRDDARVLLKDESENEERSMPPNLPFCLQCNANFSSSLCPHRCFFCRQRFCENCLRNAESKGEDVKACAQCYENYKRLSNNNINNNNNNNNNKNNKNKNKKNCSSNAITSSSNNNNNNKKKRMVYAKKSASGTPLLKQTEENSLSDTLFPQGEGQLRTDVTLSDFQLVTTLGRGTFGKVLKVFFRENGQVYAMKVLSKSTIFKRRMTQYIKEEKNIMALLPPHPFIVRCHFAFQTDYHLFFILDFLPGGELYSHVYPRCIFSHAEIRLILAEIVLAVEHLHRHDIVHRDVKPENIVFAADGHIKLADFGLARMNFSRHRRRSFVGSPEYVAPEMIRGENQTSAVDWWSVGVLMYELFKGSPPFHAGSNSEVYSNILNLPLDLTAPCFTPEAASLIGQLLERQPKCRLSDAAKIKAHPYFASINWSEVEKKSTPPPIQLRLRDNDTRYFRRELTSEWAVILKPADGGSASVDLLTSRFSNFVYTKNEGKRRNAAVTSSSPSNGRSVLRNNYVGETTKGTWTVQSLLGPWCIVRAEIISDDGKIAYPWGGDVCGLLAYFHNGMFTMQLTLACRRRRVSDNVLEQATLDDFAEMYNSYAASFGRFEVNTESNSIVHHSTGSICPNFSWNKQKYFVELSGGNGKGGFTVLKLSTAPYILQEENMSVRTILTWERVSSI